MNKLEIDREQILDIWNKSFEATQRFALFPQKPPEYYYNQGVVDVCRLLFGEKEHHVDKW